MRRTVLIKRKFQLAFIARLVGLVVVGGVLGAVASYVVISMKLQSYSSQLQNLAPQLESSLLISVTLIDGLVILLVSAAVAWLTAYRLHRVVGPLVRLERIVRSISEGDLSVPVKIRRHDELQEFPQVLSHMVGTLTHRIHRIREAHAGLRAGFDDLADEQTGGNQARIDALRQKLEVAETVIAEFQVPSMESRERRTLE